MFSLLSLVVSAVMLYFAWGSFKRGGPKQLTPWSFLAIGLGNLGIMSRVLLPIGIALWLIDLFRNRSSQRFR